MRADQIGVIGAVRADESAHMPGRTLGGPVALHAFHGVHHRQAGFHILAEVHEEMGKIPKIRVR